MEELTESSMLTRDEYTEVERFNHRGIEFFVAVYNEHAVLEPVHEEVRRLLPEDENELWADSSHTWARGMSINAQKDKLWFDAKEYIDRILDGKEYADMLVTQMDYLVRRMEKHQKRMEFFKTLEKKHNETNTQTRRQ